MSDNRKNSKKDEVPIWFKPTLSIEETSRYSGIGMSKLYELTNPEDCPFVLWIGTRRMIKRRKFDEYIESVLNMREESQMDSEVNCQREWFKSRGSDVPLWHRQNLSIEETAAYTGIGRDTIYKLIKQDDCNFTLCVGKRTMIKRKRFEEYLEKLYSI